MKRSALPACILLSAVLFLGGCGGGDRSVEVAPRLPRGVAGLMLGGEFDAGDEHAAPLAERERTYRYEPEEADYAVYVHLDEAGGIDGLSWSQYIPDRGKYDAIREQARFRFGDFLRESRPVEGGEAMLFEDGETAYRIDFLKQEIRITVRDRIRRETVESDDER